MTRWFYFSLLLTIVAIATVFSVYFLQYDHLRAQVPVHWDIHFEPDGFVPRESALWWFLIYPSVMLLVVVLNLILPWLSPKNFKVDSFRKVFDYVMAAVVTLFAYLLGVQLFASLQNGLSPGRWFIAGIFLFFALIGNVMGQVQRNFWMGVRTPWTLASETVWIRTHRLTAWLWTGMGLAGFAAVLVGLPFLWCFVLLMMVALYPILHSLIIYKRLEKQGRV